MKNVDDSLLKWQCLNCKLFSLHSKVIHLVLILSTSTWHGQMKFFMWVLHGPWNNNGPYAFLQKFFYNLKQTKPNYCEDSMAHRHSIFTALLKKHAVRTEISAECLGHSDDSL